MFDSTTLELLNELLARHSRSLPTYLNCARPWFPANHSTAERVLQTIAEDQRTMVDRIGTVIMANSGIIFPSEFPMEFTDMHDLSVDYLIPQVMTRIDQDIAWMRACVERLNHEPAARAIAEEALGAAQAHRDGLKELSVPA